MSIWFWKYLVRDFRLLIANLTTEETKKDVKEIYVK